MRQQHDPPLQLDPPFGGKLEFLAKSLELSVRPVVYVIVRQELFGGLRREHGPGCTLAGPPSLNAFMSSGTTR